LSLTFSDNRSVAFAFDDPLDGTRCSCLAEICSIPSGQISSDGIFVRSKTLKSKRFLAQDGRVLG